MWEKTASSSGQLLNITSMDDDTGLVRTSCSNVNAVTVKETDSDSL